MKALSALGEFGYTTILHVQRMAGMRAATAASRPTGGWNISYVRCTEARNSNLGARKRF